jgi:mannose-1-phosphate guanylyltransferase
VDILVITSQKHAQRTRDLLTGIPDVNVIGEPMRRNTAAACVVGALLSDRDEIDLVVPADHYVPDPGPFWEAFDKAVEGISSEGGLFTFGIEPSRPDTGYGYIQAGDEVGEGIFKVDRFHEKPDEDTASDFLERGGYYWNSGMFLWKAGDLLAEMKKCSPDIFASMEGLDPRNDILMTSTYPGIPARSVDHAVMELSANIKMVKGSFNWSDVGNWLSIVEMDGHTEVSENRILAGSKDIYIRSDSKRPIGVVGLDGVIIIETDDGLLICSSDQVQKVREISKKLPGDN